MTLTLLVAAFVLLGIGIIGAVVGYALARIVRDSAQTEQREMAAIAARKEAVLAEHAAWIKATSAMLDECVADGSFTQAQAGRYRRFVR